MTNTYEQSLKSNSKCKVYALNKYQLFYQVKYEI